jgi:hypothetical protein
MNTENILEDSNCNNNIGNLNQIDLLNNNTKQENKIMNNKVNLLDLAVSESVECNLELIKLGSDETAILPFTASGESVDIHYCHETEINSYIVCNGPDCLLCRIGRKKDPRILLPVYLPTAGCIAILSVNPATRPFGLLPQVLNVLKAGKPMVMFVTRNGSKYTVSTVDLQNDVDGGDAAIKQFCDDYEAGLHDLTAVYPRIDNEELANIGEIGRMMALKGIKCQ